MIKKTNRAFYVGDKFRSLEHPLQHFNAICHHCSKTEDSLYILSEQNDIRKRVKKENRIVIQ